MLNIKKLLFFTNLFIVAALLLAIPVMTQAEDDWDDDFNLGFDETVEAVMEDGRAVFSGSMKDLQANYDESLVLIDKGRMKDAKVGLDTIFNVIPKPIVAEGYAPVYEHIQSLRRMTAGKIIKGWIYKIVLWLIVLVVGLIFLYKITPKELMGVWKTAGVGATYSFLLFWAFLSFIPLIWLVIAAFIDKNVLLQMPPNLHPHYWTFDNFVNLVKNGIPENQQTPAYLWVFREATVVRWFFNTFLIASLGAIFNLFFDALTGWTLAKREFPGRAIMFWLIVSLLMIPPQVTLVPLYQIMVWFKLYDTYSALLLTQMAGVFGIFLMKQYIQTLPSGLEDAARIDGSSEFGIFMRMIVPLCKPVMAVLGIFVFVANWNNFLWPLIILKSPAKFTLQLGLATLQTSQEGVDYGIIMAGAAVAAVPMIILFLSMQKYFMKGLTLGGMKE
jgi:multiple sugar transport system permease protein